MSEDLTGIKMALQMVSDRVTEMEERTSTLEREDVSRQENAYRSCQNKGGTKRLQFVPL